MDLEVYELLSLLSCFVLSAFFSGSEAVLMSLGIDRARQLIEEGGSRGDAMLFMVEKPSELLTTILVGNNVVNIFAASLTTTIAERLFENNAVAIAVGITTFIILIFGEIIPKTFARTHAESLAFYVIRILQFFFYALYPVVKGTVVVIHKLLGENAELTGRLITRNDIEYMVQKAEKENTMDSKQLELLNSILEFPKIKVKDIMIPRTRVKYITMEQGFNEIIEEAHKDTHSRYPVTVNGDLDNVKGFLHVKDLAFIREDIENFKIEKILKSPFFVYEHMKIQAVFDYMNRKKVHLALVKDENGVVVGIVTLEDIVEEIMGEIQDEHDKESSEILKEYHASDLEVGITLDGRITLLDLDDDYEIKIPLNDQYSTLAGFLLDMLGNNFPEEGQIIVWEGLRFEIKKVKDYEIKKVFVKDVNGEKHLFSKKEAHDAQENTDQSSSGTISTDVKAKPVES